MNRHTPPHGLRGADPVYGSADYAPREKWQEGPPDTFPVDSGRFVLVDPSHLGPEGEAQALDLVARGLAVFVSTGPGGHEVTVCTAPDHAPVAFTVAVHPGESVLVVGGPSGAVMDTEWGPTVLGGDAA